MLDNTGNQGDATLVAEKPATLPQPQTFTQEDVDKAVRDARSAALADVGRFQKESANAMKAALGAQERVNQMVKEEEARELEEARGDPDRLSIVQERQKRRAIESELGKVRLELQEKDTVLQHLQSETTETQRSRLVEQTANRFRVDVARLAKLARYTDGSIEAIEDLAKELTAKPVLIPDSGGAIGGTGAWEEVRNAYIKDPRNPEVKRRYLEMRSQQRR